ncbi:helix-turn-helix domain-containing protein [Actinophytocola algeriensis]|uniref:Transcriptional regulator with XRE-family HTH domain n=1 Tax=Actinophytocola algeriensis TaxID=1768010 RepID=A0A7W7Q4C0_9PSEU|nr:helix-turn-helix transcriptional regulator [Actinophytocola algeriensis]MBB4906815.1 transcriptional regulator with XRE-family HTH domain [Actinophytocola algeriensis]MBE1478296.1 transcriptional regulator with XRE-family HTH domain [Actinophytocola algeriensis]
MGKRAPFLRRRLGRRLREIREGANFTLAEAAKRLDKTRSALQRIETGATRADVHFIRSAMDVYDHYDATLVEEAREAAKPPWFRSYGIEDAGYVDVETYAASVKEFSGLMLPGLLHTEAYIHALFGHSRRRRTPDQLRNDIEVRLIRKERLTSTQDPLELSVIIDESALRREVGGPDVMQTQLRQLIEMAELPSVSLQVLPLKMHSALDGGFTLLSFHDRDEPDLLYVEYATGSLHIEEEGEVRACRLKFDRLGVEALSPDDSIALIKRISQER